MTLQDRIKEIVRRRPGTTQSYLAQLTGRDRATVHLWFHGPTQKIPLEVASKIADYAGLAPKWVAFGEGPMEPLEEQDRYKTCSPSTHALIDYILERPAVAESIWSMIAAVSIAPFTHPSDGKPTTESVDDLRDASFATTKSKNEHQGKTSARGGKAGP